MQNWFLSDIWSKETRKYLYSEAKRDFIVLKKRKEKRFKMVIKIVYFIYFQSYTACHIIMQVVFL